jgi:CelD/BcsL family acetyltransferase involved in cellulose biosynthesis
VTDGASEATGATPIVVTTQRGRSGFDRLAPEWHALHRTADASPFLSPGWLAPSAHDGSTRQPFILEARRDGVLVGVLPLAITRLGPLRRVAFLGEARSDYGSALLGPGAQEAERCWMDHLTGPEARTWDICDLRRLHPGLTGLSSMVTASGMVRAVEEGPRAYFVRCDGDWSDLEKQGPHWLKRMRRKMRAFGQAGGTVERHLGAPASLRLAEAAVVDAASWKRHTGLLSRPESYRFFSEQFRIGQGPGLELWIARLGREPVAYAINLYTSHWLGLYQGAFREDQRAIGPGSVLEYASIRAAWERGVREYDYMTGDGAYKLERTDRLRALEHVAIWPDSARGWAARAALVAARRLAPRAALAR